jgi:outer membrane usher protein
MISEHFYIVPTLVLAFFIVNKSQASEPLFNAALLEIDHPVDVNIHQFDHRNNLPAGRYTVDVVVNGKFIDKRDVLFVRDNPDAELHPCFVALQDTLADFGVKVTALNTLKGIDKNACINPDGIIEGASWLFNGDKLTLNIGIPQAYLDIAVHDYISPSRWDEGINAIISNYDFSAMNSLNSDYDNNDYYYLNLRNGANLGAWRLRNYSTLNSDDGGTSYHSISTYVQRDIAALRSQIMVGDTWTASDIFDSNQIRGARIYTDDDMLPTSMTGFAPVVRGIAKSNATVIIRQNGYVIYQSAVPQGAFAITDLNTTSSGGDLDVTVKEEDGSEQHFTQPYTSLAILKREGQTDVDISIGELRGDSHFTPTVLQAQALHGSPWGITLYGGLLGAEDYAAAALGVGKDMGVLGALSFDITQAKARFDNGEDEQGQSYRFLYSKRFEETDTTLRLVGYRYSTEGYYTLGEWADRHNDESDFWTLGNRRSRIEGTWTQAFERGWGNIYLTLSRQQYWRTDEVERLVQFGYNNYWHQISWNLSWNYTDSVNQSVGSDSYNNRRDSEQVFMLSISIPLSKWISNSYLDYSITQNTHGSSSNQLGLSGTALEHNNLSWNVRQSYAHDESNTYGGSAGVNFNGTYGAVNASYDYSHHSQKLNYGASGGILIHDDGVTFSQALGETVALIKAPGAAGVNVENETGAATDWRGYTVKTQMNPYDENRVAINSDYYRKENIEIENNAINIVPTRGAVVKAEFVTHVGYRILFDVRRVDGKPIPFGSVASLGNGPGMNAGIVGDEGMLYLSGMPLEGDFTITGNQGTCTAHYHVNDPVDKGLIQIPVICK